MQSSIMNNKKVLLGMSGGTDSSVAAMKLLDMGYDVVGVTFLFHDSEETQSHISDAISLASRLGIKHFVHDAHSEFEALIVDYFVNEYLSGRTPVPCTICNNKLKWPLLIQLADEEGAKYVSTGHYMRTVVIDGTHYITSAKDEDKDQTFFLWGLTQDVISRMLLPMGDMLKSEARSWAESRGFQRVAKKKDSIGVCFCPNDYRTFIKERMLSQGIDYHSLYPKGKFVDEAGNIISTHEGYPFYTIGQRRGLGVNLNRPLFVKDICPQSNKIVLSSLQSLEKLHILLTDTNIVSQKLLFNDPKVEVKLRYRKQYNTASVSMCADGKLQVDLNEPLTAVAPGQAIAFYKDKLLIGGGIIECSW